MAFDHKEAHRVSLRTAETKTRSPIVAQRCGSVLEGQLRQAHRQSDRSFSNEYLYGLLREDHATARAQLE
jgi:RimJ/RimL family protein N-acetyltransferase